MACSAFACESVNFRRASVLKSMEWSSQMSSSEDLRKYITCVERRMIWNGRQLGHLTSTLIIGLVVDERAFTTGVYQIVDELTTDVKG